MTVMRTISLFIAFLLMILFMFGASKGIHLPFDQGFDYVKRSLLVFQKVRRGQMGFRDEKSYFLRTDGAVNPLTRSHEIT